MFRVLLSSRVFVVCFVIFMFFVTGVFLWSQHVKQEIRASEAATKRFLQGLEAPDFDVQPPKPPVAEVQEETPLAPSDDTPEVSAELSVKGTLVKPEASLSQEAPEISPAAEDVFPDFKTTPPGFPLPTLYWDTPEEEQRLYTYKDKLLQHVLVKLWHQGVRNFVGGSIDLDTGRVRPHYTNALYVEWEEVRRPDGIMRVITSTLGSADSWMPEGPFDLPPPSVRLIDINSPEGQGIDPYAFLTSEELP